MKSDTGVVVLEVEENKNALRKNHSELKLTHSNMGIFLCARGRGGWKEACKNIIGLIKWEEIVIFNKRQAIKHILTICLNLGYLKRVR